MCFDTEEILRRPKPDFTKTGGNRNRKVEIEIEIEIEKEIEIEIEKEIEIEIEKEMKIKIECACNTTASISHKSVKMQQEARLVEKYIIRIFIEN